MEDPVDYVNVTFWHQGRFISKDGFYVRRQAELREEIPPQIILNELSEGIQTLGSLFSIVIMSGGATAILMSLCMQFSLHWLWVLLHMLQLIIHLPVFSIEFPTLAHLFYD